MASCYTCASSVLRNSVIQESVQQLGFGDIKGKQLEAISTFIEGKDKSSQRFQQRLIMSWWMQTKSAKVSKRSG